MQERTSPQEKRYDKLGPTVVKALQKRHFDAYYCQSREEAINQILNLIPETDTISWGGSQTLEQLNLLPLIRKRNPFIDRDTAATTEERMTLMRQALLCDTFLMSSNAITEDGQLYNIDNNGNRLAALTFGPKSVIVIAGMNKIVKTITDAQSRARNLAAPTNAGRLNLQTPCTTTGTCTDCLSPQTICATLVQTRVSKPAGKIKIILIGEPLGM